MTHLFCHSGLIVSDVGRSAAFYSDVIGLQQARGRGCAAVSLPYLTSLPFPQLRRPDFDRHGAWFTLGNVELHLVRVLSGPASCC